MTIALEWGSWITIKSDPPVDSLGHSPILSDRVIIPSIGVSWPMNPTSLPLQGLRPFGSIPTLEKASRKMILQELSLSTNNIQTSVPPMFATMTIAAEWDSWTVVKSDSLKVIGYTSFCSSWGTLTRLMLLAYRFHADWETPLVAGPKRSREWSSEEVWHVLAIYY